MADTLFFSRDTKVYLQVGAGIWEIPVLDGFSFSQTTNTTEVTLNEMSGTDGATRRGRRLFNDSFAPAEWSFSTYVRPFVASGTVANGGADDEAKTHAVEEALWAMMVGEATYTAPVDATSSTAFSNLTFGAKADGLAISWANSNVSSLGTGTLFFVIGKGKNNSQTYKMEGCVVNEASVDFDVEGIATINWSGMGTKLTEVADEPTPNVTEGTTTTSNFIRNRLTSLTMTTADDHLLADGVTADGDASGETYDVTLTGGNITISNNINFITPETLGVINEPFGAVTGTRSIGGSFTCYLNAETDSSADLFERLIEDRDTITNSFGLIFNIGGTTADTNRLQFTVATAHLEIPTHSIDDIISLETNFHGLPSTIDGADEVAVKYFSA